MYLKKEIVINQAECFPVLEYDEAESFPPISNMDAIGVPDKSSFSGILVFNSNWSGWV